MLSVLVPAGLAAVWVIAQAYQNESALLERNLRDSTRALAMVVDRELASRVAIARVLSSSQALDRGAELTPENLDRFAHAARRVMAPYDGWVVLAGNGIELLNTRIGATAAPSAPASPKTAPLPGNSDSGTELPTVTSLANTAQSGNDGGLHAAIVQPVVRDGVALLTVSVTILPREMQRIIDQQRLPQGWVAAIVDSDGKVVARYPGGSEYAGRMVKPDLKNLLTAQNEGLFESVDLDGHPVAGYFASSTQGWSYVTAMPQKTFAHLPIAVGQLALAALALLALALGGASRVARVIIVAVCNLKDLAEELRDGKPVQPKPSGVGECDDVAAAMVEASESLLHARSDLEHRVADAVAQTRKAEQHLSRTRRVEALGRLTGGVAHDFNNVLGIISNSAHLIQRDPASAPWQAPLAATLRAVDVGSRLTQHLLRVAGRQPVRPQSIDLARYLQEAKELLRIVLGKRIALQISTAEALSRVTVDSSELELALINLALNARDAMPDGGHVSVSARAASAEEMKGLVPGTYVTVAFVDSGAGIHENTLAHVLEPFFTTKAAGKGTGLGLSQVHGFCVQAGGTVLLASGTDDGTAVSLVLPGTESIEPELATRASSPLDSGEIAGKRVLLVEDNAELGDSTAGLLESYGCRVEHAHDAAQALQQVETQQAFDVVLSDVVMPGDMDGLTMARRLRARYPNLPIVLISGYSSALTEARDFMVLHKPCGPQQLVTALTEAIRARMPTR
ncbi:MAG: response regulator [Burkholderiales bacterium]